MPRPDRIRRLGGALAAAGTVLLLCSLPAGGAAAGSAGGGIDIVQVGGMLDPLNADLVERAIADAEARDAELLVFQLDASGALDTDPEPLVRAITGSSVPIAVWVGPSRAGARGAAALLGFAAPYLSLAGGAGIGPVHPVRLDDPGAVPVPAVRAEVVALQQRAGRSTAAAGRAVAERVPSERAESSGLVDSVQPTVGDLVVALDGEQLTTASGTVTLDTADVVGTGADRRRRPNQEVRFVGLGLVPGIAHTLVTPWIAYFLLIVGLSLVVFEFFTISVGLAGGVGALCVVGAGYGLSHLPVQWWAFGLLLLGVLGFSIDLQAGGLGFWTGVGAIALLVGSLFLYGGAVGLAWWVVLLVCLGTAVFFTAGMTAMVRSRFSTPTTGREDLVGEMGAAEVDVAPDGVVRVRDALWKARTNRATPIRAGAPVRVVSIEGFVLEVEPETGGARDHRERRERR